MLIVPCKVVEFVPGAIIADTIGQYLTEFSRSSRAIGILIFMSTTSKVPIQTDQD